MTSITGTFMADDQHRTLFKFDAEGRSGGAITPRQLFLAKLADLAEKIAFLPDGEAAASMRRSIATMQAYLSTKH